MVICKASNGRIFGGYTSISWQSQHIKDNPYQKDSHAFLFSVNDQTKYPVID